LTLQERVPCDCVPQSLFARVPALLLQPCAQAREGYPTGVKFAGAAARCRSGGAGQVARSPAASGVRHVVVCARQRHQRPALPLLSGPAASIFSTNLPLSTLSSGCNSRTQTAALPASTSTTVTAKRVPRILGVREGHVRESVMPAVTWAMASARRVQ